MKDQIRTEFETAFPLPEGVTFDGDHYVANASVLGAYSNATIWSHMYRGWRMGRETLCIDMPGFMGMNQMFTGVQMSEIRAQNNYNQAIADCRLAIHSKGIRTC